MWRYPGGFRALARCWLEGGASRRGRHLHWLALRRGRSHLFPGGVTTCAARGVARAGLKTGGPGRACHLRWLALRRGWNHVFPGGVTTCATRQFSRWGRRGCRSEDRRSQAGVLRRQSGGWWFLGPRDVGEEVDVVSPAGRAMPAGGRRSEGVPARRSGGWIFLRSRDRGEQTYATSPAGGGLCRLKPAFQAGGAVPAWRPSGRCAA